MTKMKSGYAAWRRRALFAALAVSAMTIVGNRASLAEDAIHPVAAEPLTIKIDNFTFTPPEVTVSAGTSITWVNNDDIPHTVAATNKEFKSKPLDTEEKFSFVFSAPGSYDYFCSLHPHMKARVIVK